MGDTSARKVTVRVDVRKFWPDNPREATFAGETILFRSEPSHAPAVFLDAKVVAGGFHRWGGTKSHPRIEAFPDTVIEIPNVPADHDDLRADGVEIVG